MEEQKKRKAAEEKLKATNKWLDLFDQEINQVYDEGYKDGPEHHLGLVLKISSWAGMLTGQRAERNQSD